MKAVYGSAQEKYQVTPYSIWSIEGTQHRFICGDTFSLEKKKILDEWMGTVNLVFMDGPWTDAILKQFYKNAGEPSTMNLNAFYSAMIPILKKHCPDGLIFIEIGLQKTKTMLEILNDNAFNQLDVVNCVDRQNRTTFNVIAGSFNHVTVLPDIQWPENREWDVIALTVRKLVKPGMRFWNPLCGKMIFVTQALFSGAITYGTEMIPRKFAEGLRSIERFGKVKQIG